MTPDATLAVRRAHCDERSGRWPAKLAVIGTLVVSFLAPLAVAPPPAAAAVVTATLVREVALSGLDPPSPDPSGIAWDATMNRFIIADSEVEEMAIFEDVNLFEIDPQGTLTGTGDITTPSPGFSNEPTGLSFDPVSGHLFVTDDEKDRVWRLAPGADGDFGSGDDSIVTSFRTSTFGNTDPEDVAFDTSTGDLFTADGTGREVYRISPGSNGVFDGVPPDGDDVTSHFDTAQYGSKGSEGLGYDPARDTILVVDPSTKKIFETSKTGTLMNTIDLAGANPRHAEDVVLAPSLADPGQMNMYVVARGVDNNANPNENDGELQELSVSLPPTGNQAPVTNAGPDQSVTMPDALTLSGSVTDDGLPDGATVTALWTQLPGAPGTATFTDSTSPTTTVTFSAPGSYDLRLTGDDTALQSSDDVTVTVNPEGTAIADIPIVASADDAEESATGSVNKGSTRLELAFDATSQTVGLRFRAVPIPSGSTILSAHVQFEADRTSSTEVNLTIEGQAADNPGPFKSTAFNISNRTRTVADVAWAPEPWTLVGERGSKQRTPNLASVIQEIVDRPGWGGGGALVLIVAGDGTANARIATSFNGDAAEPLLHVEYSAPV